MPPGVYVITPGGKMLGRIPIPEDVITNLAFGGPEPARPSTSPRARRSSRSRWRFPDTRWIKARLGDDRHPASFHEPFPPRRGLERSVQDVLIDVIADGVAHGDAVRLVKLPVDTQVDAAWLISWDAWLKLV